MRWKTVLLITAVALFASAQLAAAACPALTVNFFPEGSKNFPSGWTREAQVAAGNEDSSSLNTIKLTASPPPKLFVQPVHPLFSRKACVPSDCLPSSKGHRRQRRLQEASRGRFINQGPPRPEVADSDFWPHGVAETQQADRDQAFPRTLNPFAAWMQPHNPFARRENDEDRSQHRGSSSNGVSSSSAGVSGTDVGATGRNISTGSSGSTSSSGSGGATGGSTSSSGSNALPSAAPSSTEANSSSSSSTRPEQQQQHLEQGVDTGDVPTQRMTQLADASGSGSSRLKDSIAAGGDGSFRPQDSTAAGGDSSSSSGWTAWREDDDWGHGEDRSLQQCLTTVAQPASYDILWNIDGGVAKKATMPKEGAPFILLNNLDTLAPGKHTLNIKATMIKGTAEVNGVPSLQPPADQVYTAKVVFNLVEGKGEAEGPAVEQSAAKPGDEPAAPAAPPAAAPAPAANASAPAGNASAPAGDQPAAPAGDKPVEAVDGKGGEKQPPAAAPAPADANKNGTEEQKPGEEKKKTPDVKTEPTVEPTVAQQAVKYYCMRQYNVGGKIHSSKSVSAGDDGVNQCAVACNALGQNCSGFGVSANKCFLMKAFNTSSSAADATLDALCMKSANDWLDFGMQTSANRVGSGFFCLRGYDIKGDPAGTGDMENPVQTSSTELAGMTPSTCATQCKGTAGCQFFLMKKPTVPGGTATCYLKMHALGGLYGNTGPSKDTIDFTCFNGQEAWVTFGGQLDYAVPSPEVNTGVQTPALAAVVPSGGPTLPTGAKTYRCIKGYLVNGAPIKEIQVSLGDEGLSQCAGKCDTESGCLAYSMAESGMCSLIKSLNFNTSGASPKTYGMCFGDPTDWNRFGNPDGSGMYCVKNYDFAGDGVRTVDYITITSGAGGVQFCKQQCAAEPQCQFAVTSLGKCYLKQNILSGSFGTTRPDTSVDASCVKGEQNWALAALQVSAAPAAGPTGGMTSRAPGNMTGRSINNNTARRTTLRSAACTAGPDGLVMLLTSLLGVLLGVMLRQ